MPTGRDLYAITYANGTFVAVGGRVIAVSADGVTWTGQEWDETNSSNSGYYFNAAAYGSGEFVIVGKQSHLPLGSAVESWSSMVLTSPDGTTWTPADSGITNFLNGVAWGGGEFVAVGDDGAVLDSPDGIAWSAASSASTNSLRSIVWGNGNFVAVGDDGTIVVSSDGVTWSQESSGITNWNGGGFKTIVYGNGLFVAGGVASGTNLVPVTAICTSPDGVNWTPRRTDSYWTMTGVAYGTNRFVGVGAGGVTFNSTNGADWSSRVTVTCRGFNGVAWADGQFVAVGTEGLILTSSVGEEWVQRNSGGPQFLSGVAYGNGRFVAVGYSGAIYSTSSDGRLVEVACPQALGGFDAVTYGNGQFVTLGFGSTSVSSDGITWRSHQTGGGNSIAWGGGLYVATGASRWGGQIFTCSNGISWITRTTRSGYSFHAVAYGNGQFIAVGDDGTRGGQGKMLSSTNGVIWSPVPVLVSKPLYGIAYGNGRFVAAGGWLDGTVLLTLPDGGSWIETDLGPGTFPSGVAFGGGQFVVIGGALLTSPDGIMWTERPRPPGYASRAITYGNGRFVAVGDNGTIVESGAIFAAPQLWPMALLSDGTPEFGVAGTESQTYTIQTSATLANWVDFTNVTITNGAGQFSDPSVTTNFSQRFYRALGP